ncbi:MAG TPA: hypothetical protein VMF09_11730 [Solirubrobacteraceae bacterium]|nr:hypothetical protein [Solirubrobacteraceae bacterium]
MRGTSSQERLAVLAAAGGLAVLLLAPTVLPAAAGLLADPIDVVAGLLPVAVAAVVAGAGALIVRVVLVRRALGSRVRVELLPSEGFDPTVEAVVRFASQLTRTRRMVLGWLDRPASAVRLQLSTGADGLVHYTAEVPRRALPALQAALGAYDQLEVRAAEPEKASVSGGEAVAVRAELVLARSSALPLAAVGLDPDPLQSFAVALSRTRHERGEQTVVAVDLMPAAPYQRRRLRRRLLSEAERGQSSLASVLGEEQRRGRMSSAQTAGRRFEGRALDRKLGGGEPLFGLQLLARVQAGSGARAREQMQALLSCFDVFAGENHLRVAGLALSGMGFLGSDLPWRRGRFDARVRTGRYAPRRRRLVGAGEIAGLLKPPSVHCAAENVARSGGVIPPPPVGLPTFTGQDDLIPLGRVHDRDGERLVGVRAGETFFAYQAGRSRYGKTETAIGQFVHLARSGHGGLFLDPHADAIREIKTYLADMPERVIEIDLSDPDQQGVQPTWNLFWLEHRTPSEAAGRVEAFVDALAAALKWDDRNTRALNIATQAAQALVELAQQLPKKLAPTIFQVPALLSDAEWRQAALPYMSGGTAGFFRDRFPRLAPDAATAVTNIIDRLRAARQVAALLGSPTSTYSAERAMSEGKIVLACPGSGGTRDRLVANLLVYDVLHAFKLRARLAPERRRPFWLFLDELQSYDGPNLPVLLEQSAKYGGRAFLFNQNPERLSAPTWNAVTTNRSHLSSTTVNAKAAQMIAREWAGQIEPELLTRLERFTYLSQVTLGARTSKPFLVHGVTARELHAKHHSNPTAAGQARDDAMKHRAIDQTLKLVGAHDQRIKDWLDKHQPARKRQHKGRSQDGAGGGTRVLHTDQDEQSTPTAAGRPE